MMATMDWINGEYGRGTLRLASEGLRRGWAMSQEKGRHDGRPAGMRLARPSSCDNLSGQC